MPKTGSKDDRDDRWNLIDTQELRGVDDNNHTENADVMADGSGEMYLRYRQPRLNTSAGGHLIIKVDEVLNKILPDLHISYRSQTDQR